MPKRVTADPLRKYFDEFGNDVTHEVKALVEGSQDNVQSNPVTGGMKVTNIYIVLENGNPKLKVEYDDKQV